MTTATLNTATATIRTCDECACGISNDDWTHLDFHHCDQEEADDAMAGIMGTLETLGWLTHVTESDDTGNFTCYICDDIQYGNGHVYSYEER